MKRRWWFLGLFAPQVVAQSIPGDGAGMDEWRKQHPGPGWSSGKCQGPLRRCKPANNECPVCGTMAPPYTQPMQESPTIEIDMEETEKYYAAHPNEPRSTFIAKPRVKYPVGPSELTTRCAHCNAAFWQDAEGKGK